MAYPYVLPELPWARNALAPQITEETINFHYGKHHQGYVTKLNDLLKDKPEEQKSIDQLIKSAAGPVFNCAAQIWNHTFYWNSLAPHGKGGGGEPHGPISDAIKKDFGGFENFKKEFSTAAAGHFGSGWAWLVQDPNTKKLSIVQTHDAGCPLKDGLKPILTCDVWEHAYYIDHRNDRAKYISVWWECVNWDFANKNL